MNIGNLLQQAGVSANSTQDISLLLLIIVCGFIFGIFLGRDKLIPILVGIYAAFSVLQVAPENWMKDYLTELALFFLVLVSISFGARNILGVSIEGSGAGHVFRVFLLSFLEIALFLSIIFSLLPEKVALEYISRSSLEYFISENFRFTWMVSPLVFVAFIQNKLSR